MTGFQSRMWIEIWHGIWNPERVWNFDLIPDGKPEFLAGQSHPGWYSPLMSSLAEAAPPFPRFLRRFLAEDEEEEDCLIILTSLTMLS